MTVPTFGGWDESNPSSGDNYTGIFNRLREIRASPSPNAADGPSHSTGGQRDRSPENKVNDQAPLLVYMVDFFTNDSTSN